MKIMKKILPYVVVLVGTMVISGCGKSYSERFSTPEARVYNSSGQKEPQYLDVDFKGFGDRDDATLFVEPDEKDGFKSYVSVEFEYTITEVTMQDGVVIHTRRIPGIGGNIKEFRSHSPNRESLDSDVQKLLTEAREYAGSPQYYNDIEKALKPTERQLSDGITIKSFYI